MAKKSPKDRGRVALGTREAQTTKRVMPGWRGQDPLFRPGARPIRSGDPGFAPYQWILNQLEEIEDKHGTFCPGRAPLYRLRTVSDEEFAQRMIEPADPSVKGRRAQLHGLLGLEVSGAEHLVPVDSAEYKQRVLELTEAMEALLPAGADNPNLKRYWRL